MTWDPMRASSLLGKHVVCGFNIADAHGNLVEKVQRHGKIVAADEGGLVIREHSDSEFSLPPDLDALQPARTGTYRLRTTGESVENPDFEVVWRVQSPGAAGESWAPLTGRKD